MTLPGLTKQQMVSIDRKMMEDLEVPVELMMEHAGSNLARLTIRHMENASDTVKVIVGSGNNGAGGMVAARRLVGWGHRVEVYAPRGVVSFRRVPAGQFSRLRAMDIPVFDGFPEVVDNDGVTLDAYLGYGYVSREDKVTSDVFDYLASQNNLISLDIPSGLDPDTGENHGGLKPSATLSIAFVKQGLLRAYPDGTGDIYVCDIGVPFGYLKELLDTSKSLSYSDESLRNLIDEFTLNSMIQAQVIREGDSIGWIAKNVCNP